MKLLLTILILLILADKLITYKIISGVQEKHPEADATQLEINHLYRWLFQKCGLLTGTIISFFISIAIVIFALWLLRNIAFWVFLVGYVIVVANNVVKYFTLVK